MKNRFSIFIFLTLILVACQKDIDEVIVETDIEDPIVLVQTSLKGTVVDESGIGLANTLVQAGIASAVTDNKGNFDITSTEIKKDEGIVTAEIPGYFEGIAASNFTSNGSSFIEIVMIDKGEPFEINSEEESFLQTPDIEIEFPAGKFVDENGNKFEGNVDAFSRYIDPSDESIGALMPGQLVSKSEDGEEEALSALSMMALDLVSENGEPLQLKEGEVAEVKMKIPDELLDRAPDEIILYIYDVEEQRWVKNGSCQKVGNYYNCTISSSGYYCCCVPLPSICLSAQIYNSDSTESCFVKVIIEDLTDNFIYYGFTNEEGFFCGSVPQAAPLKMTVKDHCDNVIYMEEIGPYSEDHHLGDIYLESTVEEYIINISGEVSNCDDVPFTAGHIAVTVPGKLTIFPLTESDINLNLALKCLAFPSLDIQIYSETEQGVTPLMSYTELGDIQLGPIQTCEVLDDHFTIEIDGESFTIAPTQFYKKDNTTSNWYVFEGLSSNETFQLELRNYIGISTYVVNAFFDVNASPLSSVPSITTSSPDITVNIIDDDGEYIEGDLNGTGYDNNNQQRMLNGTFRIKKAP